MPDSSAHSCAAGHGILCGLEAAVLPDCALEISGGKGTTSGGECLSFAGGKYKFYRQFKAVKDVFPESSEEVSIYELLADRQPNSSEEIPLTPQAIDEDPFIRGKVALLYLPKGKKEGIPLLIPRADLLKILADCNFIDPSCLPLRQAEADDVELLSFNTGESEKTGKDYWLANQASAQLSPIRLMRFGFGTAGTSCDPAEHRFQLKGTKFKDFYSEYTLLIEDGLKQFNRGVKELHRSNSDLFTARQTDYARLYVDYLLTQRWEEFKEAKKKYVQYFYDFVHDLSENFNELIAEIRLYQSDCSKHKKCTGNVLLLGETGNEVAFGPSIFRSHYVQPPVYNLQQERLDKIRFLHWRMAMLIKCFYLPGVESEDIANYHYSQIKKLDFSNEEAENLSDQPIIRITPSRDFSYTLGERSIPFYYFTADDPSSIHHYWSYRTYTQGTSQELRSYHAIADESYTDWCSAKRPLAYDLRNFPLYRIEGGTGWQKSQVEPLLDKLRTQHVLAFEYEFIELSKLLESSSPHYLAEGYRGVEHVAGVLRGERLILVTEKKDEIETVIGDFTLPCCGKTPPVVEAKTASVTLIDGCTGKPIVDNQISVSLDGKAFTKAGNNFTLEITDANYGSELNIAFPAERFVIKKEAITFTAANYAGLQIELFPIVPHLLVGIGSPQQAVLPIRVTAADYRYQKPMDAKYDDALKALVFEAPMTQLIVAFDGQQVRYPACQVRMNTVRKGGCKSIPNDKYKELAEKNNVAFSAEGAEKHRRREIANCIRQRKSIEESNAINFRSDELRRKAEKVQHIGYDAVNSGFYDPVPYLAKMDAYTKAYNSLPLSAQTHLRGFNELITGAFLDQSSLMVSTDTEKGFITTFQRVTVGLSKTDKNRLVTDWSAGREFNNSNFKVAKFIEAPQLKEQDLTKVNGVGGQTKKKFEAIGLMNISTLANTPTEEINARFVELGQPEMNVNKLNGLREKAKNQLQNLEL